MTDRRNEVGVGPVTRRGAIRPRARRSRVRWRRRCRAAIPFRQQRRRDARAKQQTAGCVADLNAHARIAIEAPRLRRDVRPYLWGRASAVECLGAVQPLVGSDDLHVQSGHSCLLPCRSIRRPQRLDQFDKRSKRLSRLSLRLQVAIMIYIIYFFYRVGKRRRQGPASRAFGSRRDDLAAPPQEGCATPTTTRRRHDLHFFDRRPRLVPTARSGRRNATCARGRQWWKGLSHERDKTRSTVVGRRRCGCGRVRSRDGHRRR